jgi:hypothetical protein
MEAEANRDFSLSHHDRDVARSTGDTVTFNGRVSELLADGQQVVLDLWSASEPGTTVTAQGTVTPTTV